MPGGVKTKEKKAVKQPELIIPQQMVPYNKAVSRNLYSVDPLAIKVPPNAPAFARVLYSGRPHLDENSAIRSAATREIDFHINAGGGQVALTVVLKPYINTFSGKKDSKDQSTIRLPLNLTPDAGVKITSPDKKHQVRFKITEDRKIQLLDRKGQVTRTLDYTKEGDMDIARTLLAMYFASEMLRNKDGMRDQVRDYTGGEGVHDDVLKYIMASGFSRLVPLKVSAPPKAK